MLRLSSVPTTPVSCTSNQSPLCPLKQRLPGAPARLVPCPRRPALTPATPRPPRATYFGENSQIGTPEEAEARFDYFRKGATLPSVSMTGGKLDFAGLGTRCGGRWRRVHPVRRRRAEKDREGEARRGGAMQVGP